jgi:phospholipase/carboxylesterase
MPSPHHGSWRSPVLAALLPLAAGAAGGCDRRPTSPPGDASPGAPPAAAASSASPAEVEFLERVTGGADRDEPLPMVVAIHGRGDRPESFAGVLSSVDFKARVIVPRGLTPLQDGYTWLPAEAPLAGEVAGQGLLRAADALAATLARLSAERPTRGKPLVTGFSQGGALSFALAVYHPEVVGAAFPLGGWVPLSIRPDASRAGSSTPRIAALHGEDDMRVPLGPTREAVAALSALGVKASLQTYPGVGHTVSADMQRDLTRLLRDAIAEIR